MSIPTNVYNDPYEKLDSLTRELQSKLNQIGKYPLGGNHRVNFSLDDCIEILWKVKEYLERSNNANRA